MDPVATAEVFQRRHIMVHSGGIVSAQYLSKVAGAPNTLKIGDSLTVDIDYLNSALDRLSVLGASIVYKISRKLCPNDSGHEHIDKEAQSLIFTLLQNRRFAVVEKIASIALPEMRHAYETLFVQINRWVALKELLGKDAICKDVAAWDVSSLQSIFELSKSILLDDPAAFILARKMIENGTLTDEMIDTWPLLMPIRKELRKRAEKASGDTANDEVEI